MGTHNEHIVNLLDVGDVHPAVDAGEPHLNYQFRISRTFRHPKCYWKQCPFHGPPNWYVQKPQFGDLDITHCCNCDASTIVVHRSPPSVATHSPCKPDGNSRILKSFNKWRIETLPITQCLWSALLSFPARKKYTSSLVFLLVYLLETQPIYVPAFHKCNTSANICSLRFVTSHGHSYHIRDIIYNGNVTHLDLRRLREVRNSSA